MRVNNLLSIQVNCLVGRLLWNSKNINATKIKQNQFTIQRN